MLEVPQTPQTGNEKAEESIEGIVNRLIIHDDKPIENLPTLTAPELKLIGRCVSLSTKQTINGVTAQYFYTGLVSAVTATAVALMYVNRYTEADFKVYVEREKALVRAVNASAQEMTRQAHQRARSPSSDVDKDQHHIGGPQHGYTAAGEVGVDRDGGITGQRDGAALMNVDAAGSLAPAVKMTLEGEDEAEVFRGAQETEMEEGSNEGLSGGGVNGAVPTRRPPHFRTSAASAGPLPYVSFLRKSIHDVRFGRDPRSSFYALFQDPSRKLLDMQYLRMFVRRYIVHTSENNNPRQVPMYAFVTVRGACPELGHELANQTVREELPGLIKADRAIERDKKRNRNREVRRELAIQEYRAPPGLFSNTGILYLTHTPQSTFLSAVVVVFFTIIFAVFLAVVLAVVADSLIVSYLSQVMRYFIASMCVWMLTGVAIGLHAINMHIPLRDDLRLMVTRAVLMLGGVACAVMTLVMLLGRLVNPTLYSFLALRANDLLCGFYAAHQCSGFTTSCADLYYTDSNLCGTCPPSLNYSTVCYYELWSQLQVVIVPLLVFSVFILLALVYSSFQFVKLWLLGRALGNSARS
ncbi:hypothetical protein ABB37_09478 [Leptomonas pyrrhocoris]|uniref:Uncharacterized protein n=1 Tax=Leptomonas pyrrhocoris TaxID=157538 RepID=A0A0N0DR20_LEPPY|nr:hypothetical protein ABB37_09478 [Leptomonas pyrrhocoris]KPA73834.1 hypothetical protein ABB37_09478 [Leptomonas pyrrhocoris]|eukprot:XP_015652273.1 hypothetical protein ABB37_09478 [Leptomonas pyrrhocoris]